MTDGTKHNHHTVPKFYLRGFSKKEKHEKVAVMNLMKGTYTEQRIGTASVIPDFYSYMTEELQDPNVKEDDFENWLSEEIERPTGLVLKKINEGVWPLDANDRLTLAKFITVQILRVNTHRVLLNNITTVFAYAELMSGGRENLGSSVYHYLTEHCNLDGESLPDSTFAEESLDDLWEQLLAGSFQLEHHQHFHLDIIQELIPAAIRAISERPWILLEFSHKTLITSDNPVVIAPDSKGNRRPKSAPQIYFPLNRRTVIIMEDRMDPNDTNDGKLDIVSGGNAIMHKYLTNAIINNAREYLYCHPDDREKLPHIPKVRQRLTLSEVSKDFLERAEAVRNKKNSTDSSIPPS